MPLNSKKYLALSLIMIVWIIVLPSGCGGKLAAQKQTTPNDKLYHAWVQRSNQKSIPLFSDTPQKQKPVYKYSVTYDAVQLQSHLDSLRVFVAPVIGSEQSKDSYFQTIQLYSRIMSFLYSGGKVDSVVIKK